MYTIGLSTEIKTPIFWCNSCFLYEIIFLFTLVTVDRIYLRISEITEMGYFISANNVFFLELEDGYNWNLD